MVVTIEPGQRWKHVYTAPTNLVFASVSPQGPICHIEARFNGSPVERLTTSVPHSWWTAAGNPLWPAALADTGDVLEVEVLSGSAVDLRIDYA